MARVLTPAEQGMQTPENRAARKAQSLKNCATLLRECGLQFQNGDKSALMRAMHWCMLYRVMPPLWAAKAFNEAYRAVVYGMEHDTWDAVLGKPSARRKRKNVAARNSISSGVFAFVREQLAKKLTWEKAFVGLDPLPLSALVTQTWPVNNRTQKPTAGIPGTSRIRADVSGGYFANSQVARCARAHRPRSQHYL